MLEAAGDAMSKMNRRDVLIGIASAGAVAGCAPKSAPPKEATTMSEQGKAAILEQTPLGFPWKTRDPFLFCVHHDDHYPKGNDRLGPAVSLEGRNLGEDFAGKDGWRMYHGEVVPGFPQHPHRGFETVTVVRRGLIDHSDSMGATARYGRGDVQWLTAGKGIQHAEMFPLLDKGADNPVELFQIWLNLPAAKKMVEPYFAMLWANAIPRQTLKDDAGKAIELSMVAGRYGEITPPSPPPESWAAGDNDVAIWTVKLEAGAKWTLPAARAGSNRTLYFFTGSALKIGGVDARPKHAIDLRPELAVSLEAGPDPVEVLLLQGKPIAEPVVQYGPFVMNTRAEIQQAFHDYQRTQFGGWPWPTADHVHAREQDRFAKRPTGDIEKPPV
jgi:quercetin 2,3-dioxygenase